MTQKEEEKKNRGPKPTTNHQQRLENIVRQTTVEARVRRHVFIHLGPFIRGLHSNCIQMVQKTRVLCEWSRRAAALQGPSETGCKTLTPLEGRNEDSEAAGTVLNGVNWEMRLMEKHVSAG